MDSADRFTRIKQGVWRVTFTKGKITTSSPSTPKNPALESLLRHGVNRKTANKLVTDYPANTIEHYIRVLDWLLKQTSLEKPKSIAGYLVQSIRHAYESPAGFHEPVRKRTSPRQSGEKTRQSRTTRLQRRVAAHLKKLSDAQRRTLEQTAMTSAEKPMLDAYRRAERQQEPLLIELYRRLIVEEHVARMLAKS